MEMECWERFMFRKQGKFRQLCAWGIDRAWPLRGKESKHSWCMETVTRSSSGRRHVRTTSIPDLRRPWCVRYRSHRSTYEQKHSILFYFILQSRSVGLFICRACATHRLGRLWYATSVTRDNFIQIGSKGRSTHRWSSKNKPVFEHTHLMYGLR